MLAHRHLPSSVLEAAMVDKRLPLIFAMIAATLGRSMGSPAVGGGHRTPGSTRAGRRLIARTTGSFCKNLSQRKPRSKRKPLKRRRWGGFKW